MHAHVELDLIKEFAWLVREKLYDSSYAIDRDVTVIMKCGLDALTTSLLDRAHDAPILGVTQPPPSQTVDLLQPTSSSRLAQCQRGRKLLHCPSYSVVPS
jgi:hypothetical protein